MGDDKSDTLPLCPSSKSTSTEADYKKHIRKLPIVYMLKSPCPVLIKTVKVVKNQRKAEKLSQPK
jgi:hypothetical protein